MTEHVFIVGGTSGIGLAAAAKLNVKFGVVEQDDCYGKNPLDVIRTSLTNLKKMGLA